PLSYRWRKNGTDLANGGNISGAQSDTLIISNIGAGDVATYTVVVSNAFNAATSAPPANLMLVQPSGSPYEDAIRAAHPVAYWRLNDTGDPLTNAPAFDYVGGRVGTYGTNAQNG